MKKIFFILVCSLLFMQDAHAQWFKKKNKDKDTVLMVYLDTVVITDRSMKNYNYNRYVFIVNKVHPIADTAITIINALQQAEVDMKKRDVKKYKNQLEDDLRNKFEDKLKNMSKTEGYVLIEIIERNTGQPLYDILKEYKSGTSAFWWQNLSRMYGYNLKDGYDASANPLLESLILDWEVKHNKSYPLK